MHPRVAGMFRFACVPCCRVAFFSRPVPRCGWLAPPPPLVGRSRCLCRCFPREAEMEGKEEPDPYRGEVTHPRQAGEQLLSATTGPAGSRNFSPGARLAWLVPPWRELKVAGGSLWHKARGIPIASAVSGRLPAGQEAGSPFEPDPFASQECPWSLVVVKEAGARKAAWMGARGDQREPWVHLGPRPGGGVGCLWLPCPPTTGQPPPSLCGCIAVGANHNCFPSAVVTFHP